MSPVAKQSHDDLRRAAVGFHGGQVLSLRVAEEQLTELRKALSAAKPEWLEVETADGAAMIKLSEVHYLRVEANEHQVGF